VTNQETGNEKSAVGAAPRKKRWFSATSPSNYVHVWWVFHPGVIHPE
jgi:hypothetical protein